MLHQLASRFAGSRKVNLCKHEKIPTDWFRFSRLEDGISGTHPDWAAWDFSEEYTPKELNTSLRLCVARARDRDATFAVDRLNH